MPIWNRLIEPPRIWNSRQTAIGPWLNKKRQIGEGGILAYDILQTQSSQFPIAVKVEIVRRDAARTFVKNAAIAFLRFPARGKVRGILSRERFSPSFRTRMPKLDIQGIVYARASQGIAAHLRSWHKLCGISAMPSRLRQMDKPALP